MCCFLNFSIDRQHEERMREIDDEFRTELIIFAVVSCALNHKPSFLSALDLYILSLLCTNNKFRQKSEIPCSGLHSIIHYWWYSPVVQEISMISDLHEDQRLSHCNKTNIVQVFIAVIALSCCIGCCVRYSRKQQQVNPLRFTLSVGDGLSVLVDNTINMHATAGWLTGKQCLNLPTL